MSILQNKCLLDKVKMWKVLNWTSLKPKCWTDDERILTTRCAGFLFFSCGSDCGCFPPRDMFSGSLINHLNRTTFSTVQLQAAGNNKVAVCDSALHPFDLTSAEWHAGAAAPHWETVSVRANVARVRTKKKGGAAKHGDKAAVLSPRNHCVTLLR